MKKAGEWTLFEKAFEKIRSEYSGKPLLESDLAADPWRQLSIWFREAIRIPELKANAAALATCSRDARPSVRYVLVKRFDPRGFVFFSSYDSRKAEELAENPHGALAFYWPPLERRVRAVGRVSRLSRRESAKRFTERPRGSKLAAWVSRRSESECSPNDIEARFEAARERYRGREVPLPPFWGGYRLEPREFEFWQGRENRLNDRFRYVRHGRNWRHDRLAP